MTTHELDTTCPHCGTDTGIDRGEGSGLPVELSTEEFVALVRSEWRRRLGRASYTRTHDTTIITTLARLAVNPQAGGIGAELERDVMPLIADLRAEGAGWGAFRHEAAKLIHAIRSVLRGAGADAATAAAVAEPARLALERALGLPRGPAITGETEASGRGGPPTARHVP